MLAESLERLLRELRDDAVVLDVGGWARPLARANWVLDLMPYGSRGRYGRDGDGPERFSAATWIQRDICDRDPYPFDDGSIDFVVCSHTLEDVRDPVFVCSEISRVGRAGYIEVPSRLEEQSVGVQGPWAGWSHHRWLVDVTEHGIEFTMKPHFLHARESDHFPPWFHATLSPPQRVQTLWWRGGFSFRERMMVGAEEVDPYVAEFVARHRPVEGRAVGRWRRLAGASRRYGRTLRSPARRRRR